MPRGSWVSGSLVGAALVFGACTNEKIEVSLRDVEPSVSVGVNKTTTLLVMLTRGVSETTRVNATNSGPEFLEVRLEDKSPLGGQLEYKWAEWIKRLELTGRKPTAKPVNLTFTLAGTTQTVETKVSVVRDDGVDARGERRPDKGTAPDKAAADKRTTDQKGTGG